MLWFVRKKSIKNLLILYTKHSFKRFNFYKLNYLLLIKTKFIYSSVFDTIIFHEMFFLVLMLIFNEYKMDVLNMSSTLILNLILDIFNKYIIEIKQLTLYFFFLHIKKQFVFLYKNFCNKINSIILEDFLNFLIKFYNFDTLNIIEFILIEDSVFKTLNTIFKINCNHIFLKYYYKCFIEKPKFNIFIYYDYIYNLINKMLINFKDYLIFLLDNKPIEIGRVFKTHGQLLIPHSN
jgi:hypothetical protein